ncbi:putative polyprotein [Cucumis melo var. makuwa]|uniref:Putative polyprotein n=1 Tax=Cucumis melo var. makuwa TaxID=1194695 RepID=A0A5D3BFY0_CUCMM|nr:putative polyprotein [Cucumis melo var. makuwa]
MTLRANKLYAKFSRYEFWLKRASFLDHVASKDGISVDPAKIEVVTNWPQLSTVSEVRSFMGSSKACEDSIQNLKQKLVTASILTVPDGSRSFVIYSDASKKGLGCVLIQQRKRRLLELVKDYDSQIFYHLGKANVVVDALSRKLAQLSVWLTLRQKIIVAQPNDPYLVEKRRLVETAQADEFSISSDDGLLFDRRLCVPADSVVKTNLLTEAHSSSFFMHPVDKLTKSTLFILEKSTYTASKWAQLYLTDIVRQHGVQVPIVSGKYARFTFKFLKGLQATMGTSFQATIGMAPFEALYGKCCRSPFSWNEIDFEFEVGDKVFLKVAPMKGVLRFEKKGKLSPRFIGLFEILKRVGSMAYCLALPSSLSTVHNVVHVSMFRTYVTNPSHVVDYETLKIYGNLSYAEQPVEILAKEVKMLRN